MTSNATDGVFVEKFARNGGSVIAVLGGLVVAGLVVGWAVDMDGVPLWVPAVSLLGGVVLYTSTIRPQVLVRGSELVLHNMFSTVHVPLATIEEIVVQQVLAVRAGERRFICSGAGRSLRAVMRGSATQKARTQATALTGEVVPDIERGMDYADYIESRVRDLVRADRSRRGISSAFSPDAVALRDQIRREPALPELAALAVTVLLVVIGFLVA